MRCQIGDHLVVDSRRVGGERRAGEIVEVIDADTDRPHFRVRWSNGHESVIYPGSDATVVAVEPPAMSAPPLEVRNVTIELHLREDSSTCHARATMESSIGEIVGQGQARRHPGDPVVPMIGEELAVARALVDLAQRLEAMAWEEIATGEHRQPHLV